MGATPPSTSAHYDSVRPSRRADLVGRVEEVHVEGRHNSLSQWIGRTSQNRTLNFSGRDDETLTGAYVAARVTRSGPNSLVGEAVN